MFERLFSYSSTTAIDYPLNWASYFANNSNQIGHPSLPSSLGVLLWLVLRCHPKVSWGEKNVSSIREVDQWAATYSTGPRSSDVHFLTRIQMTNGFMRILRRQIVAPSTAYEDDQERSSTATGIDILNRIGIEHWVRLFIKIRLYFAQPSNCR